jgi:hypothetical protein
MSTSDTIRDKTIASIEESARLGKTVHIEEAPGYFDIQKAILRILRIRCAHHTKTKAGLEYLGHTSDGRPWGVILAVRAKEARQ